MLFGYSTGTRFFRRVRASFGRHAKERPVRGYEDELGHDGAVLASRVQRQVKTNATAKHGGNVSGVQRLRILPWMHAIP